MAEGVGTRLEAVLKKIRKAWYYWKPLEPDAHNTSKYWRKCKYAGFGSRIKSKQLGSTVNELNESFQFLEEDISDLKLENKKLQQDVCELQKQLLYMETNSRRENVKFVGLLEEQADNMNGGDEDHNGAQAQTEDTRGIICTFLEHQLGIPNARERIEFQRLHRLGKRKVQARVRLLHVFCVTEIRK